MKIETMMLIQNILRAVFAGFLIASLIVIDNVAAAVIMIILTGTSMIGWMAMGDLIIKELISQETEG